jgi:hypothetical protein
MSSFRRINNKSNSDDKSNDVPVGFKIPGVKSWINNGLGLVSLGNKQVDELLGGGLVLGTALLIETDSFSNYGETLFLYSLSESISMQHDTLLVSLTIEDSTRLISLLPYNQTYGVKTDQKVVGIQTDVEKAVLPSNVELKNKGLNIAWQYAKYLPKTTGMFVVIVLKLFCYFHERQKPKKVTLTLEMFWDHFVAAMICQNGIFLVYVFFCFT